MTLRVLRPVLWFFEPLPFNAFWLAFVPFYVAMTGRFLPDGPAVGIMLAHGRQVTVAAAAPALIALTVTAIMRMVTRRPCPRRWFAFVVALCVMPAVGRLVHVLLHEDIAFGSRVLAGTLWAVLSITAARAGLIVAASRGAR